MKKLFIFLALCTVFVTGCETTNPIKPTPEFVLVGESTGDSVGTSNTGNAQSTVTISSSQINFTDADSMKVEITIAGSTNNSAPEPFQISYNTGVTTVVYSIPASSFSDIEQTLVTVLPSPDVLASFRYSLTYTNTDGLGGYAKFKDLKVYKK
jgi:hypothetical protein